MAVYQPRPGHSSRTVEPGVTHTTTTKNPYDPADGFRQGAYQATVGVAGGTDCTQRLRSAEVLNVGQNRWDMLPDMGFRRAGCFAAAALMVHHRLLVIEAVRRCKEARGGIFLTKVSAQQELLRLATAEALIGPVANEGNWLLVMIDTTRMTSGHTLQSRAETILDDIRNCPPAPGFERVEIPGERERHHRAGSGGIIAIPEPTWNEILKLRDEVMAGRDD